MLIVSALPFGNGETGIKKQNFSSNQARGQTGDEIERSWHDHDRQFRHHCLAKASVNVHRLVVPRGTPQRNQHPGLEFVSSSIFDQDRKSRPSTDKAVGFHIDAVPAIP